jgi:hypothetical protein
MIEKILDHVSCRDSEKILRRAPKWRESTILTTGGCGAGIKAPQIALQVKIN